VEEPRSRHAKEVEIAKYFETFPIYGSPCWNSSFLSRGYFVQFEEAAMERLPNKNLSKDGFVEFACELS
jgi:hypothetical protein